MLNWVRMFTQVGWYMLILPLGWEETSTRIDSCFWFSLHLLPSSQLPYFNHKKWNFAIGSTLQHPLYPAIFLCWIPLPDPKNSPSPCTPGDKRLLAACPGPKKSRSMGTLRCETNDSHQTNSSTRGDQNHAREVWWGVIFLGQGSVILL